MTRPDWKPWLWLAVATVSAPACESSGTDVKREPELEQGDASTASSGVEVCSLGESRPCDCSSGEQGYQTCIDVAGDYSTCGCSLPGGSDVLVPPPKPVPMVCGDITCEPYLEEDTEVGAKHCCVDDTVCGSGSKFIFGEGVCVPRGGEPGVSDPRCPDESPNFLDLVGCCRPDGMCGLSLDANNNFDLGCIERTEIDQLIEAGDMDRRFLSMLFSLEHDNGEFEAIPCN